MILQIVALISGLLFGLGMMVSGMIDPAKVIGFLDIAGNWDPSLAFVMGGALSIFMPVYFLIVRRMNKPVCDTAFRLSKKKTIDVRLIIGSVMFGLGWGIAGICPGPAVTSLSGGGSNMLIFVASMVTGIWLSCKLVGRNDNKLKADAVHVN